MGIEAENIFEACDLKNFKERIFKVPLFMDDDEHIFYSPLASTKARNPYIVLGFTPIKRFSQQEVSPKGKGKTSTVQ